MEKPRCNQAGRFTKKGKKKQVRDDLDRMKQAEKKKRRLEKALANSAAIRSELEKKKQKKMEEQQRLDVEGAAIAEAVALHVLLGEDSDESCRTMLNDNRKYYPLYCSSNPPIVGYKSSMEYSMNGLEWATNAYGPARKWNDLGINQPLPPYLHVEDFDVPYNIQATDDAGTSSGLIAAQAFSSLRIVEDSCGSQFAGQGTTTMVVNRVLRNDNVGNEV
ncbi:hypothetical protein Cni_G07058 [Canna indica]|uniref:Uncharacterized protein n=1 Tax=Canna indica TaxID=4628 RepID=A0AAQ3Q708_9LILI|nr:hypothetical protein Cni_G07058 [Canna indica]